MPSLPKYDFDLLPQIFNGREIWWLWWPAEAFDVLSIKVIYDQLCLMPRSIIFLYDHIWAIFANHSMIERNEVLLNCFQITCSCYYTTLLNNDQRAYFIATKTRLYTNCCTPRLKARLQILLQVLFPSPASDIKDTIISYVECDLVWPALSDGRQIQG